MNRRDAVIALFALGFTPHPSSAQQAGKAWRIGFLSINTPDATYLEAFKQGLRELGYVDARNITIDFQIAAGATDQLADLAADLVRRNVDLIVATSSGAGIAAKKATGTIPIVVVISGDTVGVGLVKSLARPGGNITGQTLMAPEVSGKRLELIRAAFPAVTRVGILWNPVSPPQRIEFQETEAAAQRLAIRLLSAEVSTVESVAFSVKALADDQAQALVVFLDSFTFRHRALITKLALESRLPMIAAAEEVTEAGGLMSYGPSFPALFRRAATFVDKILKGAKPADLPIERPTKFKLVVNLNTARALGLTIPSPILLRADRVIE